MTCRVDSAHPLVFHIGIISKYGPAPIQLRWYCFNTSHTYCGHEVIDCNRCIFKIFFASRTCHCWCWIKLTASTSRHTWTTLHGNLWRCKTRAQMLSQILVGAHSQELKYFIALSQLFRSHRSALRLFIRKWKFQWNVTKNSLRHLILWSVRQQFALRKRVHLQKKRLSGPECRLVFSAVIICILYFTIYPF